jgi:transcriptional regulator with XRE-family HTH domain
MFEPLPHSLRVRREQLGLSQGEVAKRAGVGRAQYALLEAGKANVTLGFLLKVARVLGITAVQVEEMSVRGAAPDLKALVRAQEAVDHAKTLLAQFAGATAELDGVSDALRELIANPLPPDPAIHETAQQLTKIPASERSSVGRVLRDLAEPDRVERQKRPDAPAAVATRKRTRTGK